MIFKYFRHIENVNVCWFQIYWKFYFNEIYDLLN